MSRPNRVKFTPTELDTIVALLEQVNGAPRAYAWFWGQKPHCESDVTEFLAAVYVWKSQVDRLIGPCYNT